jgi:hypothetical protein
MEDKMFELMLLKKQENELVALLSCNEKTKEFGLVLTNEEARELVLSRNESLKNYQRIEFSSGILENLIFSFCDSSYINQNNYAETLMELQDIFYMFKNESDDKLTDDELITFMKEQFDSVCSGDTNYLADTCLERFAQAIRAGYTGYIGSDGHNEYEKFSLEQRWDKDLYLEVLSELFWN